MHAVDGSAQEVLRQPLLHDSLRSCEMYHGHCMAGLSEYYLQLLAGGGARLLLMQKNSQAASAMLMQSHWNRQPKLLHCRPNGSSGHGMVNTGINLSMYCTPHLQRCCSARADMIDDCIQRHALLFGITDEASLAKSNHAAGVDIVVEARACKDKPIHNGHCYAHLRALLRQRKPSQSRPP